MRSTIFFKSSNGNLYFYDFLKKEIKHCHPIIYECYKLDNGNDHATLFERLTNEQVLKFSKKELSYYCNKYYFYKDLGYFTLFDKEGFIPYEEKDIINSISNINHIVFEITDACNLQCKYCAYGELYDDYDARSNKRMSFETVKSLIEYLKPYWVSHMNKSADQVITVGFYGGEPLMNFELIKETVEYCNNLRIPTRRFVFSMTTNATLVDKYVDFLVNNNFNLTISLDGDEIGNSYRIFHNGKNSFSKVVENVRDIQKRYPNYFSKHVSFNSVLHNRNSVESTHSFIYEQFGKIPEIHAINSSGIKQEKKDEFNNMFVKYSDSLISNELKRVRFTSDANIFSLCQFLLMYGNNQFFDYVSFLYAENKRKYIRTGTCFPFSRKMYVTVNNKILPCEKISAHYFIGQIKGGRVCLDFNDIARKYNDYYSRMQSNCEKCYMVNGCTQCIFQLNLKDKIPHCNGFSSHRDLKRHIQRFIDILEDRNIEMKELLNNVFLS